MADSPEPRELPLRTRRLRAAAVLIATFGISGFLVVHAIITRGVYSELLFLLPLPLVGLYAAHRYLTRNDPFPAAPAPAPPIKREPGSVARAIGKFIQGSIVLTGACSILAAVAMYGYYALYYLEHGVAAKAAQLMPYLQEYGPDELARWLDSPRHWIGVHHFVYPLVADASLASFLLLAGILVAWFGSILE